MNKLIFGIALMTTPLVAPTQAAGQTLLADPIQLAEDRTALKTLVDTFSELADVKGRGDRTGVLYKDEYVRRRGQWLIAKRTSNFIWRDREGLASLAN